MNENKIPVIIDADPGIDDFLAIMLANSSSKLDIRAITSVCGNQTLEKTTKNALDIAEFLNMDVVVASGAPKPLNQELIIADRVHGENGIAGVELKKSTKKISEDYAWDLIYKEAKKLNGKLEIIAIGPLTNIAIAVLKYPDIKKYIKRIIMMGGSSTKGNVTPYAEFNTKTDAIAADIVLKSKIPITMVGLNVTMASRFYKEEIDEFISLNPKMTSLLDKLLNQILKIYKEFGYDAMAIHDALAVSYLIDESVLEVKDYYVTVETYSELNFGRTVVDLDNSHRDKEKNVSVAINVDKNKFKTILKEMILWYK